MTQIKKMDEMVEFLGEPNKPFYIHKKRMLHNAHDIGYCIRQLYLQWMGVKIERQFDPDIAQAGKDIENRIIEKCKVARIFLANSVRTVSNELGMSYEIDLIISDPFDENNVSVPVEIKSCNHRSFTTYYDTFCPHCHNKVYYKATYCKRCRQTFPDPIQEVKTGDDGSKLYGYEDEPAEAHIWQLMIYIMDNNFPHGYIIYKNKNTSKEAWYQVKPDPIIWDKIRAKIRQLNDYVARQEIPERPFNADWDEGEMNKENSDTECIKCPFPKYCWDKL